MNKLVDAFTLRVYAEIMMKRGPKPKRIVNTTWSSNLAYAIGLIATDGCLSRTTTLIDLTSKDKEQLQNFNKCISLDLKLGRKNSGFGFQAWRVQLKNRIFYDFLISIGLTPAKSKTLGTLKIPNKYFYDFLRGCFDGDGSFYSYWDPRWKSSFMFYTIFASASPNFILWIQAQNLKFIGIIGHIGKSKNNSAYQLKYAKKESLCLLNKMYHSKNIVYLSRKKLKIDKALGMIGESVIKY